MAISYHHDRRPEAAAIAELYRRSPLYRPVDDVARIARMYSGCNVVITAYQGQALLGILRGWTDGAYDGYVCDLAVDPAYQKLGIGRRLLEECRNANSEEVQWVLRASKIASDYYRHLGWLPMENGWFLPRAR